MESQTTFEHYAVGEVDYNKLSEEQIDNACYELFKLRPIPFVPKKGEFYQLQKDIEKRLTAMGSTIPMAYIQSSTYLVGSQRQIIQNHGDQLIIKVGGGYFKFEEYIPQNQQFYQRTLLMYMIKSKMSLEWVCEAIMND